MKQGNINVLQQMTSKMILVKYFKVSSLGEEEYLESVKELTIEHKRGNLDSFVFNNEKDLYEFTEELRQSFEYIFPFGCKVEAKESL